MVPYVVVWYEIFASLQENVAVEHLVCEHPAQYVPRAPFCNLHTWSHGAHSLSLALR